MAVLEVADLVVQLGGRRVLDGVSLVVEAGERVCLLGASGSGKSVTARVVVGQPPNGARVSGRVRLGGTDVTDLRTSRRPRPARAAMVFQDSSAALHPLIPIGRQLVAALTAGAVPTGQAPERAVELLEAVGLPAAATLVRRFPAQLSGGQRQRVCVAHAMATRSPLLVADEPTTALDMVSQAQLLEALRSYTSSGTPDTSADDSAAGPGAPGLLFITHDLAVATSLCDRLVVLAEGRVVDSGAVAEVVARPSHPYTAALVAAARGVALPPGTWPITAAAA